LVILRKRVAGLNQVALTRFVGRASRAAHLRGAVNVLVTNSRELQRLNQRFRGNNKPTDVLSFPAMPGLMNGLVGEVAISAEIAGQNARRLGHTVAEEIKILTLHGVLHLAGYDHQHDQGEMARREERLRVSLGLPAGLIERTAQPTRDRAKLLTERNAKTPQNRQTRTIRKANGQAARGGARAIRTSK